MTRAHDNTRRVCIQHHVLTHDVLNHVMKTIGERIRQAREYRGLSGEQLAHMCGYKNQSGISNLENRASTSGGTKIVAIARALDVSVKWVLDGPDVLNMQEVKRSMNANQAAPHTSPAKTTMPAENTTRRCGLFRASRATSTRA